MNIIFLDIDGVLNHLGCKVLSPSKCYFVEDDKLILLKELIEKTEAKIVLSSTWRSGWKDLNEGKETTDSLDFVALKNKLKEFNVELLDYTPLSPTRHRGTEILTWIENHLEETDNILILDDGFDIEPLRHFLVRTSIADGLKEKHIKRGIEILLKNNFKEWYKKYKEK